MPDYIPILDDLKAIGGELAAVGDDALAAVKAGARHSGGDLQMIQGIADAASDILDLAVELGAADPDADEDAAEGEGDDAADPDAMKMAYDDPLAYAAHECGDVMGACAALQTLAQLAMSELGEKNPGEGTLAKVTGAMRLLTDYLSKEIDAIGAGGNGMKAVNYDQVSQLVRDAWAQQNPSDGGLPYPWPTAVFDNAIIISKSGDLWHVPYTRQDDKVVFAGSATWVAVRQAYVAVDGGAEIKAAPLFGGKKRDDLEDADFAGPGRTYPIMTAKDVTAAAILIGKADDPDAVKKKIIAIAKRKGFADALPESWVGATKGEETFFLVGDAVKSLDGDRVGGLAIRFSSADEPDMSQMRDYFSKDTQYWLDAWKTRPMLYHHAMEPDTAADPIVGTWTKASVTDEGIWLEGELSRSFRYHTAIKEMMRRGLLHISTDSSPHLVVRERQTNGTNAVKRWPIACASLTVSPAEPRLSAVSFKALVDELGLSADEVGDDTAKAIELELIAIDMELLAIADMAG